MAQAELRIFGDAGKFRRKLRYRIETGEYLVDLLAGARERISSWPTERLEAELHAATVIPPYERRVASWRHGNRELVATHLGALGEALFDNAVDDHAGVSSSTQIDALESSVGAQLRVLRQLLDRIPPPGAAR
jgi:hypothetical protein